MNPQVLGRANSTLPNAISIIRIDHNKKKKKRVVVFAQLVKAFE